MEQPEAIFCLDLEANAVAIAGPDSTFVWVGSD
jgi:hypothetical protein